MIKLALFILFLPLLSFVLQIFFGRRFEDRKGEWVSVGLQFITLIMSLSLFVMMISRSNPDFSIEVHQSWLDLGLFKIDLGLYIDNITIIMLNVVAIISSLVHLYGWRCSLFQIFRFSGNIYFLHVWYCLSK